VKAAEAKRIAEEEAKKRKLPPHCRELVPHSLFPLVFPSSNIVDLGQMQQLNAWYGTPQQKWKLLYRASEHGFTAASFHQHCDYKGPTMVIVKSTQNYIFGGYGKTCLGRFVGCSCLR